MDIIVKNESGMNTWHCAFAVSVVFRGSRGRLVDVLESYHQALQPPFFSETCFNSLDCFPIIGKSYPSVRTRQD